jgi:hypothetical protein
LWLIGGKVSEITAIQSSGERHEVVITNIDIPFLTLVRIMVKWIIAAIPAMFVATLIYYSIFYILVFGLGLSVEI